MSCYAPGRDAPRQLIEGPEYEISPEEVRMLYYLAKASGDVAQIQAYVRLHDFDWLDDCNMSPDVALGTK